MIASEQVAIVGLIRRVTVFFVNIAIFLLVVANRVAMVPIAHFGDYVNSRSKPDGRFILYGLVESM